MKYLQQNLSRSNLLEGDPLIEPKRYTFFSHLESMSGSIKVLPFTILLSLLIAVAPHLIRLIIVPGYT